MNCCRTRRNKKENEDKKKIKNGHPKILGRPKSRKNKSRKIKIRCSVKKDVKRRRKKKKRPDTGISGCSSGAHEGRELSKNSLGEEKMKGAASRLTHSGLGVAGKEDHAGGRHAISKFEGGVSAKEGALGYTGETTKRAGHSASSNAKERGA